MLNGWACLRFPCKPGSWPGRGRVMPRGRRGLGVLGLLLALAASGRAQQLPATPAKSAAAAVPDSPKPLAPRQLEEALRLLRADSVGHATRRTGSEALVMDQTISKLGRDFYELFYGSFEAPADLEDFTVVALHRQRHRAV